MLRIVFLVAIGAVTALPPQSGSQNCFDSCKCEIRQDQLKLSNCEGPISITENFFKNVHKGQIQVISINNVTTLNSLEKDAFSGFTNLKDVVITNSHIGSVDSYAFENVTTVNFKNCLLEDNPTLVSNKLQELHFAQCRLTEIPNLNHLPELTFLNLAGNFIKEIKVEAFENLRDLEEIHLESNLIESFPANVFVNNDELISLYLDNNPLTYFSINTTNNLELLSLKSCKLTKFDTSASRYLNDLTELYLNNNSLTYLHGTDMAWMTKLINFDVSSNFINKLLSDVFQNNTDLQQIILDNNPLLHLPLFVSTYEVTFKTSKFSCKNCRLEYVANEVFERMTNLYELNLSKNKLRTANSFAKLHSLQKLDLSDNNIMKIGSKTFADTKRLVDLNLAGNKLASLDPSVFIKCNQLTNLNLNNNELQVLWVNRDSVLNTIRKLYLNGNGLTTLTTSELNVTPGLTVLQINNNPWDCNEDFTNMMLWLNSHDVQQSDQVTHLNIFETDENSGMTIETEQSWLHGFAKDVCPSLEIKDPEEISQSINTEFDVDIKDDKSTGYDNYLEEDDYDEDGDDDDDDDYDEVISSIPTSSYENIEETANIHYASYIISVTLVFFVTALLVLCSAVAITLLCLKKNGSMQRANLPRFKLPATWVTPGQKKHSGSIYRPLSEEISSIQTPKLHRYEFNTQPTVHSANP